LGGKRRLSSAWEQEVKKIMMTNCGTEMKKLLRETSFFQGLISALVFKTVIVAIFIRGPKICCRGFEESLGFQSIAFFNQPAAYFTKQEVPYSKKKCDPKYLKFADI